MDRSYWDIDSIVTDNQRVPCTFNLTVPGLGHLQGGNEADMKEGTRLELPFWIAEILMNNEFVSMHMPKPYAQRIKSALDAEPSHVNLKNLCNWWYALGLRVDNLTLELGKPLTNAYLGRIVRIYSSAQHLSSASMSVFGESSFSGGGGGAGDASGVAAAAAGGMRSAPGAGGRSGGMSAVLEAMGLPTGMAGAGSGGGGGGGASGGGGGGSLSAEMSDFLNGLDESERLLLREANLSNNISRAYLAGHR